MIFQQKVVYYSAFLSNAFQFVGNPIVAMSTLSYFSTNLTIYTEAGTSVTDKTLKEWINILPESLFYHCHRSFKVNISYIKKILPDKIVMDKDDLEAYLTKRKHTEIKKIWMLYIESSN